MSDSLQYTLPNIEKRIKAACLQSNRNPEEVLLLAVSKRKTSELIRHAHQLGLTHFAENYLQEALAKQQELSDCSLTWHFIGSIQSNKCVAISQHFDWVHTIDREKIARRLNDSRETNTPLQCCIQYNISHDDNKSGLDNDQQLLDLARYIEQSDKLTLRGLMTIPKAGTEYAQQAFHGLREKLEWLKQQLPEATQLDTLSMGMTQDFEQAIQAGSTCVRIGSALFGQRD